MKTPISAYQETLSMLYFARMLDKIRKHHNSELREDFHENLGEKLDGRCLKFLRVEYSDLVAKTLTSATDEDVLRWCFEHGRELDGNDIFIWNQFCSKLGLHDQFSDILFERKKESDFAYRDDIVTMLDYFDADEGRPPQGV